MQRRECGSLVYLEFDLFQEFSRFKHAIFLRHGGESKGVYNSLNVSYSVGDDPAVVDTNMSRIYKVLGISNVYRGCQTHGKCVTEITRNSDVLIPNCDGLMTETLNVPLMMSHADCQVAVFYDPVHHAVANVHCGWKGSVLNIYQATVAAMRARYRSKPADLLVGISPSLGPKAAQFINYKEELLEAFYEHMTEEPYFDFWAISRQQLKESGVLPHHIEIAGLCTRSLPEDYFSFRREKITGRHATIVELIAV